MGTPDFSGSGQDGRWTGRIKPAFVTLHGCARREQRISGECHRCQPAGTPGLVQRSGAFHPLPEGWGEGEHAFRLPQPQRIRTGGASEMRLGGGDGL